MDNLTAQLALAVALVILELVRWLRSLAMKTETEYLTLPQAAKRIGVLPNHLRRLFERGLVPAVKIIGGRRLVPTADLDELKKAAKREGY